MTNANLPGRWITAPVFDDLTDKAWRVFTYSLMHGAEQGTDGRISARALRLLHPEGVDAGVVQELVTAGLWEVSGTGWMVVDWTKTQSTAEQVEHYRARSRTKKAKQRAAAKQERDREDQEGESPGGQDQGTDLGESPSEVVQTRQDKTRQDLTEGNGSQEYLGGAVVWGSGVDVDHVGPPRSFDTSWAEL